MPLSPGRILSMLVRRVPIGLVRRTLGRAEDAGIALTLDEVELHLLAGGNIERCVEAMVLARQEGVPAQWREVTALDFIGRDPISAVQAAAQEEELAFDRFTAEGPEPIIGYTGAGERVRGACTVRYRPGLLEGEGRLPLVQERLAARLAVIIHTAESLRALELRAGEAEAQLLALARGIFPSVSSVRVLYRPDE